jgi:hypothetical protein
MNSTPPDSVLGEHQTLLQTTEAEEIRQQFIAMCSQARNLVRISSPRLNPAVFDHEGVRKVLSALARSSRYSEVRLLVSQPQAIIEQGHSLLALSRRLSSAAPMRELALADNEPQPEYILVDDSGVIEMGASEQDPASIYYANRVRNKALAEGFDHLWQKSRTPIALRSLIV